MQVHCWVASQGLGRSHPHEGSQSLSFSSFVVSPSLRTNTSDANYGKILKHTRFTTLQLLPATIWLPGIKKYSTSPAGFSSKWLTSNLKWKNFFSSETFYFEITRDSHAVVENNRERPCTCFTVSPNGVTLQNDTTISLAGAHSETVWTDSPRHHRLDPSHFLSSHTSPPSPSLLNPWQPLICCPFLNLVIFRMLYKWVIQLVTFEVIFFFLAQHNSLEICVICLPSSLHHSGPFIFALNKCLGFLIVLSGGNWEKYIYFLIGGKSPPCSFWCR